MSSLWKSMKPLISRAEIGLSYLRPCLTLNERKSRLTRRSAIYSNDLTSICFHSPALQTLVEQSNTKANIHTHSLLLDLSSQAILNEYIGRVCSELVSTIRNLGNDLSLIPNLRELPSKTISCELDRM